MVDIETIEKIDEKIEVQVPKMYKVLLHNDDTTTFEFVIYVLHSVFHKSLEEAITITEHIHLAGQGIAGAPYTKEIAEEKIVETTMLSRANNFPLTTTFEEV